MDVVPLHRMLEYLTPFESAEEHSAVGQLSCLLFSIKLLTRKISEALPHAYRISKIVKKARQGFNNYPNFLCDYLKCLALLANYNRYLPQLMEILSNIDVDDKRWLSSILSCNRFNWYAFLSSLYSRTGQQ